jgi:hypothetical protein
MKITNAGTATNSYLITFSLSYLRKIIAVREAVYRKILANALKYQLGLKTAANKLTAKVSKAVIENILG